MKKYIVFYAYLLVLPYHSFPGNYTREIPHLNSLISNKLFEFKNRQEKGALNQRLKRDRAFATGLRFNGITLKGLDLSGMYLREINFSGCRFVGVNLTNADLTDTLFEGATFDSHSNLSGAIIYYPVDSENKPMMDKALRIKNSKYHYALVEQYSEWMGEARKKGYKDVDLLLERAASLNKFLGALPLWLNEIDLMGFDLTNINLQNAYLKDVKLGGAWLSDKVQVPENDTPSDLFKMLCSDDEQKLYQKFFNARVDFITGVDPEVLRKALEKKVKENIPLNNAYLSDAKLEGAHLEGAQLNHAQLNHASLKGAHLEDAQLNHANLRHAQLQGVHLEGAQLNHANLFGANLQGAWLSDKVQIPQSYTPGYLFDRWCNGTDDEQELYQKLFNAGVNFMTGVDPEVFRKALEKKVKENIPLNNAYLGGAKLEGAHLEGAHLNHAYLGGAKLEGAHLEGAQLNHAYLYNAKLEGAHLEGAELNHAALNHAKLEGAHLEGAQLNHAELGNTKLEGAHLKRAQLNHANLYHANLYHANLNHAYLYNAKLEGAHLEGAKLHRARLSQYLTLLPNCRDEDLVGIYEKCTDLEARIILEQIILGKEIKDESYFSNLE